MGKTSDLRWRRISQLLSNEPYESAESQTERFSIYQTLLPRSQNLFPCCVCLSCDQVTGYAAIRHRVTAPLFFPTPPLDENTRLGTCCDWKLSTRSSLWGSDPALYWEPWLKSKKALKLSARLSIFRTRQEMNPRPRESPAKQKGEKDQDTRTDQSFSRTSHQVVKYRPVRGAYRVPSQALRSHSSCQKAQCFGGGTQNHGASESRSLLLLPNFFSRKLTQAANYCQDLHERMFLELLLLPNWISGSLCLLLF